MMRLSLVFSLLSLPLVSSSVAASEKKTLDQAILDSVLTEDEDFWARNLEEESMSIPPGICVVTVEIGCEVGEGTPCNEFVPDGNCVETAVWTFEACNIGEIDLEVESATLDINGDIIDLDVTGASIVPDECFTFTEELDVDFCVGPTITTQITIEATPGPCEAEDVYTITPQPPVPTAPPIPGTPSPTTPPATPPPTVPEARCEVEIEVGCTSGEGINCDGYVPTGDDCNSTAVFTYSITNVGDAQMEILAVTVVVTDISGTSTTTPPVSESVLPPGGSTVVNDEVEVQWCIAQTITSTVSVLGAPGPCDDETTYVIVTGTATRRVSDTSSSKSLRGF